MSQKTIIILYNGIETKLIINLDEINTYDLFMKKIYSIITDYNPSLTYNLMTLNTSEAYTIIDSNNYMKIMKEQIIEGDLKLFLNKPNIDSIENTINDTYQDICDPPPVINDNHPSPNDENDDEDFIIEQDEKKENEIKEENKNINEINGNLVNEEQLKINEITNINKEKSNESDEIINNDNYENEDDENNIYTQTNLMLDKIKKVMDRKDLEIYKHSKTVLEPKINNNNIISNYIYNEKSNDDDNFNLLKNDDDKQNNNIINQDKDIDAQIKSDFIKLDTFKDIKCSFCKDNLSGIKYICCVCENCILCTNCESEHFHPCIKFKTPFLSNLPNIYNFLLKYYSFKIPSSNFFSKFFRKEIEISLIPLTDKKICLRQNKEVLLPIKIINLSKEFIRSSQFDIIPKDNRLVQIYNDNQKFSVGPNLAFTLKMKCFSGDKLGKENITLYGFSEVLNFKNQENLKINLEFEVNKDEEEENMNEKLGFNENVILYNKQHKQIALNILDSIGDTNKSKEHINKVFNILLINNWNKDKSINKIKNMK